MKHFLEYREMHDKNGFVIWLAAVAVAVGCSGQPASPPEELSIADVPPSLMEVARKALPGVEFDRVYRKPSGTLEIRGKAKNGKIREVEVRPDGTVEEIE